MIRRIVKKDNIHETINETISVLQKGGIVAYPTETFYALGVKFDMIGSLKRLYELKMRPEEKAMPVIIGSRELLSDIVSDKWLKNIPMTAKSVMDRLWPGPLTLLFPAREGLSAYLTANTGMIAARIPGKSFAFHLAERAGFPITATSANLSGMPPARDAATVIKYFNGKIDLIVDRGQTPGGLPSTIIDVSGGRIKLIRKGVISCGKIIRACGVEIHEQ